MTRDEAQHVYGLVCANIPAEEWINRARPKIAIRDREGTVFECEPDEPQLHAILVLRHGEKGPIDQGWTVDADKVPGL